MTNLEPAAPPSVLAQIRAPFLGMGAAMADQPGRANPVLYRDTRRAAALYQQQPLALAINEVVPGTWQTSGVD